VTHLPRILWNAVGGLLALGLFFHLLAVWPLFIFVTALWLGAAVLAK
jgi:hypothetical protein